MPDSIYLIVSSPNTAVGVGQLPPTRHGAYLVELQEGETEEQAVARTVTTDMIGCDLTVFGAATGTRYRGGPTVELIADEESGS